MCITEKLVVKMEVLDVMLFSSSSSSSSSESESDFDEELTEKRPKIKNFVFEVVSNYTDAEFKENFRMHRQTFNHVLNLIKDKVSTSSVDVGHPSVDAKQQLLIALWYFATPDSYRSICGRFNIGKATGQRIVRRVTDALCLLSPSLINWPDHDNINLIKTGFTRKGFPNTIGCIDGSYIPIPQPKVQGISYICRKNFACIILQAVCDHRMMFTNCYIGEVGSVHDATVLKRSHVWNYLKQEDKFPENTHLLGDKAYPLLPTLITPYKDNGHLTEAQRLFNYVHSKCRSTIERAFALLKARFRLLKFMDVRDINWGIKYVLACCVLHNICILQNDILDINLENEPLNDNRDIAELPMPNESDRQRYLRAVEKRNAICAQLTNDM